ncbi:hypothetical protein ACFO0S_03950 [Chryseomicrobium palamuruense]|uniref:Uncharacterized protein n=1 Tax=Chryseomicrobium palamuruense TaxID=682973 RepID=A0ABV8UTG7_9BACL
MQEAILLSAIALFIFHTVLLLKKRFIVTERFTHTVVTVIASGAGFTSSLSLVLIFKGDMLWSLGLFLLAGYICGAVSGYASTAVSGAINGSIGSVMGFMLGEVLLNPELCGLPIQEWQLVLPIGSMIYFLFVSLIILLSYR